MSIGRNLEAIGLLIKSKFKCVHFIETCSADESVHKVAVLKDHLLSFSLKITIEITRRPKVRNRQ